MGLRRIQERLARLNSLVKGWEDGAAVSQIERDIALEELRRIYDAILDYDLGDREALPTAKVESKEESRRVVIPAAEVVVDHFQATAVDDFDDALDIDALLGISVEEETEAAEESVEIEVAVIEERPAKEEAPIEETMSAKGEETVEVATTGAAETPTAVLSDSAEDAHEDAHEDAAAGGALFNLEDIPVRAKSGRRMVQLYSDGYKGRTSEPEVAEPKPQPRTVTPAPAPKPEPKPQPVPEVRAQSVAEATVEEQTVRLGDVLGGGVTTLADKMAVDDAPTMPFNKIKSLREAIGLNDKFLMIRDLFAGDAPRYEATIDTLDEFEDLGECMIYIVENFRWNPDSEGAKLLVSLIERKLA
jgi:hypothetical protein